MHDIQKILLKNRQSIAQRDSLLDVIKYQSMLQGRIEKLRHRAKTVSDDEEEAEQEIAALQSRI